MHTPRRKRNWTTYKAHARKMLSKQHLRRDEAQVSPLDRVDAKGRRYQTLRGVQFARPNPPHFRPPVVGDPTRLQPPVFTAGALPKHRRNRK